MSKLRATLWVAAAAVLVASVLFRGGGADPDIVASKVERGALIIDVRTPREFDEGHVSGAVNIPYDTIDRVIHQTEPDTRRDIVLYCRSGRRSALAAQALARVGYTNVVDAGSLENARAALEP